MGRQLLGNIFDIVNMLSVRIIIAIAKIHNLDSKVINFVLTLPQSDLEEYIWMHFPIGFQVYGQTEADPDRNYILKLNKSIYGLKQAKLNWYKNLKVALVDQVFKPSYIDPCLNIVNIMIILTYVDDCIIDGPSMVDIDYLVNKMKDGPENFVLTDKGDIDNFLGIEITQLDENIFKISQPYLIDRIVSFLGIDKNNYGTEINYKSARVGKPLFH